MQLLIIKAFHWHWLEGIKRDFDIYFKPKALIPELPKRVKEDYSECIFFWENQ